VITSTDATLVKYKVAIRYTIATDVFFARLAISSTNAANIKGRISARHAKAVNTAGVRSATLATKVIF
jgi:hypothetical protein